MTHSPHNDEIIRQFTQQAEAFSRKFGDPRAEALRLCVEAVAPAKGERILDVACGPGITTCAFAPLAAHVTGIDLTPAMIEQAKQRAQAEKLTNIDWHIGDVLPLPYADNAFDTVFTRFSLHHFEQPLAVMQEMLRTCRPGGKFVVADVYATDTSQQQEYDRLERLRDSSHVMALTQQQLHAMFAKLGLAIAHETTFRLPMELEAQLRASAPQPGSEDTIRHAIAADIGHNHTGFEAQRIDGQIIFSHPVIILTAFKPAA